MDVAGLYKRLEGHGLPPHASTWVIKALHPAWATVSGGIPDLESVKAMRSQYEVVETISTPTPGTDWDCAIWKPPGDGTAFIAARGPLNSNFLLNTGFTDLIVGATQAMVDVGTMPLNDYAGVGTGTSLTNRLVTARPQGFRKQYSSLTVHLVASAFNNQGTVYSSQLNRKPWGRLIVTPTSGVTTMLSAAVIDMPPDESILALSDPGMVTAEAKHGTYVPLRLNGPTQPFVNPLMTASAPALTAVGSLLCPEWGFATLQTLPVLTRTAADTGYIQIWEGSGRGALALTNPNCTTDTGLDNVANAMVIFRGLSATASLTIKSIDGIEYLPHLDSPSKQYAAPAAAPCLKALELYYMLSKELAYAYPASYNSIGLLLSTIAKAASYLWPKVLPLIPTLASALVPAIASRPARSPSVRSTRSDSLAKPKPKVSFPQKKTRARRALPKS